ncbi:MAG: 2-oxoglutarate dehydrogenase, E2 component, dihydrolipoamide succinyltransferase, partial [Methanobacteriota archaeon]
MKVDVLMPKLGESVTEGTIVKWWKQPGDFVKKDETLLEISTDKVDSEIPSPFEGVLVEIKAQPNETVAVDSVIAVIDTQEEGVGASVETSEEQPAATASTPQTTEPAPEQPSPVPAEAPTQGVSGGTGIVDVEMPRLGEGITEGTIVKWWKKPGDFVKKDETLLEISTDKVDSEIPSPFEGTLVEILVQENETVPVGTPIARLQTGNGAVAQAEVASETTVTPEPAVAVSTQPQAQPVSESAPLPRQSGGRFYSPLVRSIARKEGITKEELERIPGTGLQGRVTKNDILQYLQQRKAAPAAAPTVQAPAGAPTTPVSQPAATPKPAATPDEIAAKYQGQPVEIIPMDAIRKKIADHMVQSKHTSPHVYGVAECDFTRVMGLVQKHRAAFQQREGFKLTVNPFILFAVARALKDFPDVNVSVEGHTIIK